MLGSNAFQARDNHFFAQVLFLPYLYSVIYFFHVKPLERLSINNFSFPVDFFSSYVINQITKKEDVTSIYIFYMKL